MSVPQSPQLHPDVNVAPHVMCVGGPCDGQRMQNPIGRVLIITNAIDGQRATSLPPTLLPVAKSLGGYAGHYECGDDVLNWVAP